MRDFPMPNDLLDVEGDGPFRISRVVASCWLRDGEPGDPSQSALVLLLNHKAPFFSVGEFSLDTGKVLIYDTHSNIVPAVRSYEDNGGDY